MASVYSASCAIGTALKPYRGERARVAISLCGWELIPSSRARATETLVRKWQNVEEGTGEQVSGNILLGRYRLDVAEKCRSTSGNGPFRLDDVTIVRTAGCLSPEMILVAEMHQQ